jgi:FHS family glucose/mannose:H+ symporter-like MFS transporter
MPFITDEFAAAGITLAAIGLIFPARSIGGILGNVVAGIGSDRLGGRRFVWLSALCLALALALAAAAQLWILFVAGFVLVSAAQGALTTGINTIIADANRNARARALNILHGVYGAGAAVSPLIIGFLIDKGLAWRWALGGTGLIWLAYGLIAYWFYQARTPARPAETRSWDWQMLREGPFLALFAIAFIYNGVAVSLLGWIAVIMQETAGASTLFSVSMISIFYIALTIGRFLCAAFAERRGYATTLLALAWGITLSYPLVVVGLDSFVVVAGVFLTGLSLSGLFPTALAFGGRLYPEQTGTITGVLNVSMTLGAMAPPLWTGIIAAVWSFEAALAVNYLMVLPLVFVALYLRRNESWQGDAQPVTGNAS